MFNIRNRTLGPTLDVLREVQRLAGLGYDLSGLLNDVVDEDVLYRTRAAGVESWLVDALLVPLVLAFDESQPREPTKAHKS